MYININTFIYTTVIGNIILPIGDRILEYIIYIYIYTIDT